MTQEEIHRLAEQTADMHVRTVVNRPHEIQAENYEQEQIDLFDTFSSYYDIPSKPSSSNEHETDETEREGEK